MGFKVSYNSSWW